MLHELVAYAEKELDSEPGFTTRTVRWLVEISAAGEFVNVLPLGGEDGRGEQTPRCPDMHGMVAGGRAHFLVETLQTVALFWKSNEKPERVAGFEKKHSFFRDMVEQAASKVQPLSPLKVFLADEGQLAALRERLGQASAKPTDWMRWRIAGADPLTQAEVQGWWRAWREADLGQGASAAKSTRGKGKPAPGDGGMICFLTGERTTPLPTHGKITGLSGVGGLGTGDVMVGFDKDAFCSYGLEQSSNAAMNDKAVSKYVEALKHLVKNHSRKLAGALVVHWFKEPVPVEDDPLAFLAEPPERTEAAAWLTAREILESLRSGKRPVPPQNRYYAMTLSGASGRVMVRDWMEGPFEDLVTRIHQWFSDLEIVARKGDGLAREPKFMAVCGALARELKDLPASTSANLWRVALAGLPIPLPFVAQALSRFRSDLLDDESFNHARMGLIKAYYIRKGGNHGMSAYLNKEHPESAYQCGRLLAMLAGLQRAALGDVGAGVVQRYYVAASQTPGLTLGRLVANAKNHLNKLEGGLAFWFEDQIAEIMGRIQDRFPRTLDMEGQGLFALGYYQQIAANRAGKKGEAGATTTTESIEGEA
ncbi:MAG: type I-C CRISPR-associated protein Cas8c/Csd1 [Desulfovibrionaceae bacterium]|nr:type I-C CRISPR-associated protein Cas8c/Csd1 [Desulfovibrionaceae bacterium]